jgi:hypothetical protein
MTQNEMIVEYIREHGYITRRDAMIQLGIGNLPARIQEIRDRGINIITERADSKSRYAKYRIEEDS